MRQPYDGAEYHHGGNLKAFKKDVDGLIEKGEKKEIAIMHVLRNTLLPAKKYCLKEMAIAKSGKKKLKRVVLPNVKTTPLALDAMVTEKAKKLFEDNNIYTHAELEARHEIELEKYIKKVQIEGRLMAELATSHILPAAIRYQNICWKM